MDLDIQIHQIKFHYCEEGMFTVQCNAMQKLLFYKCKLLFNGDLTIASIAYKDLQSDTQYMYKEDKGTKLWKKKAVTNSSAVSGLHQCQDFPFGMKASTVPPK